MTVTVKRKTVSVLCFNSQSQNTAVVSLILSKVVLATTKSSNSLFHQSLKNFEINYRFRQIVLWRYVSKIRILQILYQQLNKEFMLNNLQFEMSWNFLWVNHLINDQKYKQLVYEIIEHSQRWRYTKRWLSLSRSRLALNHNHISVDFWWFLLTQFLSFNCLIWSAK